jgi:hypothetical protein
LNSHTNIAAHKLVAEGGDKRSVALAIVLSHVEEGNQVRDGTIVRIKEKCTDAPLRERGNVPGDSQANNRRRLRD